MFLGHTKQFYIRASGLQLFVVLSMPSCSFKGMSRVSFINLLSPAILILFSSTSTIIKIRHLFIIPKCHFIFFYVRLFMALDVNRDEHIDFKELCCGISAACRGPMAERMKCISHQII